MAKKKTTKSNEIDYSDTRNSVELYLAKAIGENVTLPLTDNERILVYLRKLIEVIEQSGGTEVIANPILVGTEDALTGLQIGETKYKVEKNYTLHNITIAHESDGVYCTFILINSDDQYTKSSFLSSSFIQRLITNENKINAYFGMMEGPEPSPIIPLHIKIKTSGYITFYYYDGSDYTSYDINNSYDFTDNAILII